MLWFHACGMRGNDDKLWDSWVLDQQFPELSTNTCRPLAKGNVSVVTA
jgi:hypothetical protein